MGSLWSIAHEHGAGLLNRAYPYHSAGGGGGGGGSGGVASANGSGGVVVMSADRSLLTTLLFAALLFWMLRRCTWSIGSSVAAAAPVSAGSTGSTGSGVGDDKRAVLVRDALQTTVQNGANGAWSAAYAQGRRAHMEDRFTVKLNIPFSHAAAANAAHAHAQVHATHSVNNGSARVSPAAPPATAPTTVPAPNSNAGAGAATASTGLTPAVVTGGPSTGLTQRRMSQSTSDGAVPMTSTLTVPTPANIIPPSPVIDARTISGAAASAARPVTAPPSPPRSPNANAANTNANANPSTGEARAAAVPSPILIPAFPSPCDSPTAAAAMRAAEQSPTAADGSGVDTGFDITPIRASLFAVFDGHGGHKASDCATRLLPDFVRSHPAFPGDARTVLKDAFKQTDHAYVTADGVDALYQGTTAVVALLTKSIVVPRSASTPPSAAAGSFDTAAADSEQKQPCSGGSSGGSSGSSTGSGSFAPLPTVVTTLHVANAGDSRAILCRTDGSVLELSHDHKPNRDDEQSRIEASGGHVIRHSEGGRAYGPFRVYTADSLGGLAVSRAFGDSVYRQPPHANAWLVTPLPEIVVHSITESDALLVIASDGLWDVFSSAEASKFVIKQITSDRNLERAAKALVSEAFRRGSGDNITVLLVNVQTLATSSSPALPSRTAAAASTAAATATATATATASTAGGAATATATK